MGVPLPIPIIVRRISRPAFSQSIAQVFDRDFFMEHPEIAIERNTKYESR
jgi:hypothetical protein